KTCLGSSDIMKVDESALTLEITTDYPDVRARCLYNEGISVSFVEEEKVLLNEVQVASQAYEVRIRGMSELPDYDAVLRNASACVKAEERVYVATDWFTKHNCLIVAVASEESFAQCLNQKGLSHEALALNRPLIELSHEFISARSEFEFLMEEVSKCKGQDDHLYLAYDPLRNLHCMLLASKDMNAVKIRLAATSVQLVARQL
ncbi:MAG: hypothetical protein ACE5PO_08625, partial [Candidatus Bathyarchaeia archaeon]